jgi:long-subunit acyl-CoA synthetase (AMP-forming)
VEAGAPVPDGLRFVAVGGAPVPPRLLERARGLGLPVYQGYGLSECASVATLNTPRHDRPGSAGRPLPHLRLRVSGSGEILVADNLFSGYLGGPSVDTEAGWWRTGDQGYLDGDGFLYLTGRKRNLFITAFGRNVSPEWVESELVLEDALLQAAVFGEARPWNLAIVVPAPGADPEGVTRALARANARLPDYARVSRWAFADEPFTPANGLLSGTGRVRRQAVYRAYRQRIESLYQEEIVS